MAIAIVITIATATIIGSSSSSGQSCYQAEQRCSERTGLQGHALGTGKTGKRLSHVILQAGQ
jgi:hypothetical protein